VHGGKYPEQPEIVAARDSARELVSRGLLHAVRSRFPSAADFNRMVLGDG
jgi:hypothetical protein